MKQNAEITYEIEETLVLRQGGKIATHFCPRCAEITEMVSPEILSLATGASEREIFRLVEGGIIHFVESGRLVICTSCYQRSLLVETIDQT